MHRRTRFTAVAALVLALVLAPAVTAAAVTIPPSPNGTPLPPKVNILPSTIKGAFSGSWGATGIRNVLAMAMLLKGATVPKAEEAAVRAVAAGTATPAQSTVVDTKIKPNFRVPAVAIGNLVKVANGVGVAYMGYGLGTFFGGLGLEVIGFDPNGMVCREVGDDFGGKVVQALSGQNCEAFRLAEGVIPNNDLKPGVSALVCLSSGPCVELKGIYLSQPGGNDVYCFTGNGAAVSQVEAVHRQGTGSRVGLRETSQPNSNAISCRPLGPYYGTEPVTVRGNLGELIGFRSTEANAPFVPITEQDMNPDRTIVCEVTASNGSVRRGASAPYKETDSQASWPACPQLPAELYVTDIKWLLEGGGATQVLKENHITPQFEEMVTNYPECMAGVCLLELRDSATNTDCDDLGNACADWFTDPNKTTKYTCHYGSHAVDLDQCTTYAPRFKENAVTSDAPLGNPFTGEPLPGTGTGMGAPIMDPSKPRNCFPEGWGMLNPIEWVAKPVGCALQDALVPRLAKADQVANRMGNAWRATTLGKSALALEQAHLILLGLSDGGCGGIVIDLGAIGPDEMNTPPQRFLPACPGDFFHPWATGIYWLLAAGITIGGFFSVKHQISRFVSNGEA